MNKTLWAIVVIIIVVVVGWFIYSMSGSMTPAGTTSPTTVTTAPTGTSNSVFMSANDPTKGSYMVDPAGKTLYTFSSDTPGVSTCIGTCAVEWPPYTTTTPPSPLPADITVITRADGTMQYAYNGMPLYYFKSDTAARQINGDGVGGFHIINL